MSKGVRYFVKSAVSPDEFCIKIVSEEEAARIERYGLVGDAAVFDDFASAKKWLVESRRHLRNAFAESVRDALSIRKADVLESEAYIQSLLATRSPDTGEGG